MLTYEATYHTLLTHLQQVSSIRFGMTGKQSAIHTNKKGTLDSPFFVLLLGNSVKTLVYSMP